jgi:hypothetical protein
MSWPAIFENFVEESPVTVMMRGTIERILSPEKLNELFDKTAQQQYTRELLFSDVVEVMMPVVAGMRPSVHASYQASKAQLGVSHTSVYNKIDGIEPDVSASLIRYSARELAPVIEQLGGKKPD